jgi:hypothetical protein
VRRDGYIRFENATAYECLVSATSRGWMPPLSKGERAGCAYILADVFGNDADAIDDAIDKAVAIVRERGERTVDGFRHALESDVCGLDARTVVSIIGNASDATAASRAAWRARNDQVSVRSLSEAAS